MPSSTRPQPIFAPRIPGAASIGAPGTFCTLTNPTKVQRLIDTWCEVVGQTPGQRPVRAIDTSNVYGFGTSEKLLAQTNLHGSAIDTKFYPLLPGDHSRTKLRQAYERMVAALGGRRVRVLYLNAPDRATPFSETFAAMDELYREGGFEMLGLSNYRSYEVAEIMTLCQANRWNAPRSNLVSKQTRLLMQESNRLIPCLRHFNIKFAAYSPLAGGYLVGGMLFDPESVPSDDGIDVKLEELNLQERSTHSPHPPLRAIQRRLKGSGSNFDPQNPFGMWYQNRYLHPSMNDAVMVLTAVLQRYNLSLHEASVRWLQHHSAMLPTDIGIVFGGTRPDHVRETLGYCMYGPLPDAVVDAFDECYASVKLDGGLPGYWCDPAWYNPGVHGY
ncbi:Aflatoxin B1-aldehyde reductase [Mycena indigotica]|uniref:Aflatoxin B1-aldehyde reductase n=1 Tax=Mycena indigotica TaxID=2126181 RepID=A0A8H6S1S9_9AGAR|nr:Aflatoxin B1-aldehyde reductase [Mycena indigotica]KAF7289735.1 Aflatoxin B1-aldehyde reductase [Mycena indigotica]